MVEIARRLNDWAGRRWLLGVALASLAGCSIDGRRFSSTDQRSLSPEGGAEGGSIGAEGLVVTPTFVDLGGVTQGYAARARARVRNPGTEAVAAPVVAWEAGSAPDLTLIHNGCGGALEPGASCDLRVQVVPSRVGAVQGTLEVASASAENGIERLAVAMTATGLEPGVITLQPAAGSFQDFGGARLGTSVEGTFTVSNPGDVPSGAVSLASNRPELALAPALGDECVPGVTELEPGASCRVRVVFTPAERGPLEATLSVTSSAAGSRSLTLRGRGLMPAAMALSSSLLDFGGVVPGDTASLELEVENEGDEALTLASPELSAAGVFRIADGNCGEGMVLRPAQRCRVQVDYRPVTQGAASAAELRVATLGGGASQSVALQGVALTRGNLVVEALAGGDEDFGDVLLGQSASRTFRVSNPTQQRSGALRLSAHNGFSVLPPSGSGACEPGVTELANGESCSVEVRFAPASRGAKAGAVTVDSLLAGAKSLSLRGRGVAPASLEVDTGTGEDVLDFGRVTTGVRASRAFVVRNGGDQALEPPAVALAGPAELAAAFTHESTCTSALSAGGRCELVVRFAPSAVLWYWASLELVSAGERSSVLLLGEALEAGRLVLAPAAGESGEFGDVAVGGSATRRFEVTNPGGGASGALSVGTDDSQFAVEAGACADAGPGGLLDGESCAIEVTFSPTTSTASEGRLWVRGATSGETGIPLGGRGRQPPTLAATATERDLGRANVGQPSAATSQFTWTVTNAGDLPSGALEVANGAPEDFDVTADTCAGQSVPGGGSCGLTIAFAPDAAGERAGRFTVNDPASGQSVSLRVTGFGVQLAAPGEACVATSDCAAGVCTGGVCCDQGCDLTCQSCATGECVALGGQEPCGNSGGVCFGVEQCSLPEGGGCASSRECGGGLVCKPCLAGGSQCTAPEACCGGCAPGYQCIDGECGCPLQADGRPRLDCGGGVCALDRPGACCPNAPPAGCRCDPSDNLCKECLTNADCTSGPAGALGTCGASRTCSYTCPANFKLCDGACIPSSQCCGGCAAGQACNAIGQCIVDDGGACGFGSPPCASGNCAAGRCCAPACGSGCFPDGTCNCPPGEQFARGECRPASGAACVTNDDCAGTCVTFYEDLDNDGFGNPDRPLRFCGSPPPNVDVVSDISRPDCCDTSGEVSPAQTLLFPDLIVDPSDCPARWKQNDLNCDGILTYRDHQISNWSGRCDQADLPENDASLPCAARSGVSTFQAELFGFGPVIDADGEATLCGNSSIQHIHCELVGGVCTGSPQLQPRCH